MRCQLVQAGQCATATDVEKLPDKVGAVLRRGLAGEPLIICANTVRRARAYYDWFCKAGEKVEAVVLYPSRFTEPPKAAIEGRLNILLGAMLGKTVRSAASLSLPRLEIRA